LSETPDNRTRDVDRTFAKGPWLVRCSRGLFRVTADELRFRKLVPPGAEPLVLRQRNHDLLFVQRALRAPTCDSIRTAEEVLRCLVYGRFKISKAQLDLLAKVLTANDEIYHVAVSVEGTHFVRRDVRRFLERELSSRGVKIAAESAHALFIFCVDAAYYIGTLWSQAADAAFRRLRVAERPGSLPPTIAAAMAFLGKIERGDTILDPVCGSGTLLAEASAYCQDTTLICADVDPDALEIARKNLAFVRNVQLINQDSAKLDLPAHSVNVILANLPFGKQFGDRGTNADLYTRLVQEFARLGVPRHWRAVLLTSEDGAIRAALAANPGLAMTKSLRLQVRGEEAKIYVVQSRDDQSIHTVTIT
jgi:predicted RNA methylase